MAPHLSRQLEHQTLLLVTLVAFLLLLGSLQPFASGIKTRSDSQDTRENASVSGENVPHVSRNATPLPAVSTGSWSQVTSSLTPTAVRNPGFAYDAADGYVLMFGGYLGGGFSGETWEFKAGQWTQVFPSPSPSPRNYPMMTYDARDGYVILFGGWDGTSHLADTWTYKAGVWTNITSTLSSSPSPRDASDITYDAADRCVLLYGGGGASPLYGDTWEFKLGQWTNITTSLSLSPPGDIAGGMTYDPIINRVVLFGGQSATTMYNYTWEFSGNSWTNVTLDLTDNPSSRSYMGFSYDPSGYLVMFGGLHHFPEPSLGDTWELTGNAWNNLTSSLLTSPSPRRGMAMTYDPEINATLLFGGFDGVNYYNDTWTFSIPRLPLLAHTPTDNLSSTDGGQSVTFTETATGGTAPYSYVWSGLPSGCTSSNSSAVNCTPANPAVNTSNSIQVMVSDSAGNVSTSPSLLFTVYTDPTTSPISANVTSVDLSQSVLFKVHASGGSGGYSYQWNGLPIGCNTADSPALNCAPTGRGSFTVSAAVTDSSLYSVNTSSLPFTVYPDPTVAAPVPSTSSGYVGQAVQFFTAPSGGSGGFVYTWTPSSTALGCTASTIDNISCTPTTQGSYTISVTAKDSNGEPASATSAPFLVSKLTGPVISSFMASVNPVYINETTYLNVTASGGTGTLSYAYSGLPQGCTSSNTESLPCTPTKNGTYVVRAYVIDTAGYSVSAQLSLQVLSGSMLAISSFTATPPTISIGNSSVFKAYVSGGTLPYTFSYTGLPQGCLSANTSTLTCKPTSTGNYSVTLKVTDAAGGNVTAYATLNVVSQITPLSAMLFANTTSITVGGYVTLEAGESGGINPYNYVWALNGTNTSVTTQTWSPQFVHAGTYSFTVWVMDDAAQVAQSPVLVIKVLNPSSGGGKHKSTPPGFFSQEFFGIPLYAYLIVLVAAILAVLFLLLRRKDQSTSPSSRAGLPVTQAIDIGPPVGIAGETAVAPPSAPSWAEVSPPNQEPRVPPPQEVKESAPSPIPARPSAPPMVKNREAPPKVQDIVIERKIGPERGETSPFGDEIAPEEVNPNVKHIDPRLLQPMEMRVQSDRGTDTRDTTVTTDTEKRTQDLMGRARKARQKSQADGQGNAPEKPPEEK